MKTNEIKEILMKSLYAKSRGIFCDNFQGCNLHECDVIRITGSGMTYEYEIKNSRSDFKADFKKTYKHKVLQGEHKNNPKKCSYRNIEFTEEWRNENYGSVGRCNYFYYVCIKDLIKESEIPQYAGLIYIEDNDIKLIKKAPKLHSFKANEILIEKVCHLLSVRNIFGSSFMTYKNNQNLI